MAQVLVHLPFLLLSQREITMKFNPIVDVRLRKVDEIGEKLQ
jgi:hypothetical protein